jgi:predicted DNA-binding transcriptional regulator AlpA
MTTLIARNTPFIVRKQICSYCNISRSTLWRIERRDPSFPKAVNLGIGKEQWVFDEIDAWAKSTRFDAATVGLI